MKQLLFLFLFPCLALAQYTGNGNQKITLGEQSTADGLVFRGLAADTTRKPSVDTMAYILLDTNTNIIWQYKKATNNAWTRVGGSISSGITGTLPVANGGTGQSTLTANKVMVGNGTSGVITPNLLTWNNSSNYLGVGTNTPLSILDVVGNIPAGGGGGGLRFVPTVANDGTTQYGITISGAGTGASQFIAIGVRNSTAATKSSAMWVEATQPGLNIGYDYADVAPNNGAIINGNVGIGTASPSEKLHVVGNGLFTGTIKSKVTGEQILYADNAGTNRAYIQLQNTSGTFYAGIQGVTANDLLLDVPAYSGVFYTNNQDMAFGTNFTRRLMIKADGKIGIGTSSPLALLNVMGTLRINSASAPDANYYLQLENSASQKAKANAWDTYSDKRIKTDIQPIVNAIDKVNLLNPVYYQKHDSYVENDLLNIDFDSSVKSLGFIAQEVYNVIPEAVNTGTTNELWAMDYTKIIPILTKAIQEQQTLIKALEQRIINLENK